MGRIASRLFAVVAAFAVLFAARAPAGSGASAAATDDNAPCAAIYARGNPSTPELNAGLLAAAQTLPTPNSQTMAAIGRYAQEAQAASNAVNANRLDDAYGHLLKQRQEAAAVFGADSAVTLDTDVETGIVLIAMRRNAEAEALLRTAYVGLRRAGGDDYAWTRAALFRLADLARVTGNCRSLMALTAAPAGAATSVPRTPFDMAQWQSNMGEAARAISEKRPERAAAILKGALAQAEASGGRSTIYYQLASLLYGAAVLETGDFATARPIIESASVETETMFGDDASRHVLPVVASILIAAQQYEGVDLLLGKRAPQLATQSDSFAVGMLTMLGGAEWELDKHDDAEKWLRRAVVIAQANPSVSDFDRMTAETTLAGVLAGTRRYDEGEQLLRAELARIEAKPDFTGGDRDAAIAHLNQRLASVIAQDPRPVDPRPYIAKTLEYGRGRTAGGLVGDIQSLDDANIAAFVYIKAGDYEGAAKLARATCRTLENKSSGAMFRDLMLAECRAALATSLVGLARNGGDAARDNADAFDAAQGADVSVAGQALAYARARNAGNDKARRLAKAYDDALAQQADLDRQYEARLGARTSADDTALREINARRAAAAADISNIAAQITSAFPGYWDLRAPEFVSIAALQSRSGDDADLLRDGEAVIMIGVGQGGLHGRVFAVSKNGVASAFLGMDGDDIADAVKTLRQQIDPCAYGSAACGQKTVPFDRALAYRLTQALIGDPAIHAVISDPAVKTLLFVQDGPLTSLPPTVFVTAPPTGRDGDPQALRDTQWLIRSKAVAVLPAVSSLRTLRGHEARLHAGLAAGNTLVAFADPDFQGTGGAPPQKLAREVRGLRSLQSYYRMGFSQGSVLRTLPRLPGTRQEAEALRAAMNAPLSSLHLGPNATETELRALSADGELAQASVIEFATHGLVAGDVATLGQPALVLAAPPPGSDPQTDDGLLTSAEVATLQINADWVILSACNTAAPDAPQALGLSGLARGFFFAGARTLLVSHWRVHDDVAPLFVPSVLARLRVNGGMSKAEAVREAALAILDDQSHPAFAQPSAWAAFVLVGEPDR